MKKVLLLIAAVAATFTAFAEDFSMAKYKEILKTNSSELSKYCYEASVSKESHAGHAGFAFSYYLKNINKQPTKQQIIEFVKKYNLKERYQNVALGVCFARAKMIDLAIEHYLKDPDNISISTNIVVHATKRELYGVAQKMLFVEGGLNHPKLATELIEKAFRYKPATITKEQQIKFIEKLAQIYPIPGTDFSQWKGFMGFIGYKYKALTGKDLFPESK